MPEYTARFNSQREEQEQIRQFLTYSAKQILAENPAFGAKALQNTAEIEKLSRWIVSGQKTSLLLLGHIGCGKTVLAKALGRTLAVRNLCPYLVSMTKLAAMVKESGEVPEFVYHNRILILDDVGTEQTEIQMYGNRYQLFNEIIYARYSRMQPTILTTNFTWDYLEEKYGGRVMSRLREMCDVLAFTGGDLRK